MHHFRFSHYNSLDWNSISLNHWSALQSWLIHPLTNFQLVLLNGLTGRSGILLVILDHVIIARCWFFCYIFMVFSSISFKPQKVWGSIVNLPLYNFQLLAICSLHCGRDNILVLFFMNNHKYLCNCLSYSNQTWYQDAPLHHLFVYHISRQSDNLFPPYGNFNTFTKRRKKGGNKPIFGSSYLGSAWHV